MSDYRYGYDRPLPAPVPQQEAPQPPQWWELGQVPVPQPQPQPDQNILCCDHCGEVFEKDEPAIELFYGRVGVSPKSGMPMVVESPLIDYNPVSLHEWCVGDFAKCCIYDDGEDPTIMEERCNCGGDFICMTCGKKYTTVDAPRFCSACDAKLSGD